jgi:hypothetical protein
MQNNIQTDNIKSSWESIRVKVELKTNISETVPVSIMKCKKKKSFLCSSQVLVQR